MISAMARLLQGLRQETEEAVWGGIYMGVAPQSELLIVKLGNPRQGGFPRTTELMQGGGLCIEKGVGISDAGGDQYQFWKYIRFP